MDEPLALGDVANAIEQAAQQTGAELIVVGTHGRRGVRRLLMGSVAEGLVRQCSQPVLLVHAPRPRKTLAQSRRDGEQGAGKSVAALLDLNQWPLPGAS
ncbi:universal stress protein [Cupriavidus basilensis]